MKFKTVVILVAGLSVFGLTSARAQIDLGADVVSRYVWRGSDFGNTASAQPHLSYAAEMGKYAGLEIGAWSSWGITGGFNEVDLYATVAFGAVSLTFTDYYFPDFADPGATRFFNYKDSAGIHVLEALLGVRYRNFSAFGAVNISGDPHDSFYIEGGYDVPIKFKEGISLSLHAGAANGAYYTSDGNFNLVNVGINVTKGAYFAAYIINPDAEISYLVFGITL